MNSTEQIKFEVRYRPEGSSKWLPFGNYISEEAARNRIHDLFNFRKDGNEMKIVKMKIKTSIDEEEILEV